MKSPKLIKGMCPICFNIVEIGAYSNEKWLCPLGHEVDKWKGNEDIPF